MFIISAFSLSCVLSGVAQAKSEAHKERSMDVAKNKLVQIRVNLS